MKDWEQFVLIIILIGVLGLTIDSMNLRWKLANGRVTVQCR